MNEQIRLPDLSTDKDFDGESFAPIYTTTVTVSGGVASHGRASGRARSDDGLLDLNLRMPAELGGDGQGTNPEQLFAAGFAACFHGALSLVARQAALDPAAICVDATVAFGRDPEDGGYLLCVDLVVKWPGIDSEVASPLLKKADSLCPYARMAWQGTPTTITLAS
ncbi:Ohr family peroxiredoxin [Streptomyces sp. NBC_01728]|uniref:Ohr family peroxiredoxin n=1 Tax=unclassified Streptomyces TaxID=2593676 RepID=UPI00225210D1|nr:MULTISPECIES: Ohr family peroxiredoxin [unclassified Streptomyces]MCX4461875.1 Ohr family peroxiredoxin [Streptomyces sp. NBC_01719]MCX4490783.1 Ohr family peroxiredoxin [Streptomyces sp. NBC_01728]MCX4598632.1 Ohr family peroxiredoxin [Streptomyces sp. NBC_01549]